MKEINLKPIGFVKNNIKKLKLIERKGNKIKVSGLDILNNTPIIDIKPYWPQYDKVKDGKIPDWVNKLEL